MHKRSNKTLLVVAAIGLLSVALPVTAADDCNGSATGGLFDPFDPFSWSWDDIWDWVFSPPPPAGEVFTGELMGATGQYGDGDDVNVRGELLDMESQEGQEFSDVTRGLLPCILKLAGVDLEKNRGEVRIMRGLPPATDDEERIDGLYYMGRRPGRDYGIVFVGDSFFTPVGGAPGSGEQRYSYDFALQDCMTDFDRGGSKLGRSHSSFGNIIRRSQHVGHEFAHEFQDRFRHSNLNWGGFSRISSFHERQQALRERTREWRADGKDRELRDARRQFRTLFKRTRDEKDAGNADWRNTYDQAQAARRRVCELEAEYTQLYNPRGSNLPQRWGNDTSLMDNIYEYGAGMFEITFRALDGKKDWRKALRDAGYTEDEIKWFEDFWKRNLGPQVGECSPVSGVAQRRN